MAVFTPVPPAELAAWLDRRYRLDLVSVQPIAAGVENTNYFVDTGAGAFVLTLLERLDAHDLPFHLGLMKHLADAGIRCPEPRAALDGSLWEPLCGKPATLVTRLPGRQHVQPGAADCEAVGRLLARMHLAAAGLAGPVPANPRGPDWWPQAVAALGPALDAADRALLADEFAAQRAFAATPLHARLPASAVHADLFRDNVLFDDAGEPGAIDFYFACQGQWLFDLAITCNDWCFVSGLPGADSGGGLWPAMLRGYQSVRPLSDDERSAWPMMLRAAAFRFWLSRLHDRLHPRAAQLLAPKDPAVFRLVLSAHRQRPNRDL